MGIGLCANSHLEGTLAKLDEFGKSDAFKKSPSIFNLLKVQQTIILYVQWKRSALFLYICYIIDTLYTELEPSVSVPPSFP